MPDKRYDYLEKKVLSAVFSNIGPVHLSSSNRIGCFYLKKDVVFVHEICNVLFSTPIDMV